MSGQSPRYFLGLDVGGTKTYCIIGTDAGELVGFGAAGCGNYEYDGVEPALVENRRAIDAALSAAGIAIADLTAVGLGVAGADLPEDFEMLEAEMYTPLFGDLPRDFKNDSFAALRGGTLDPFGIAVACGTDSVCAGISRDGVATRVGGFGPEFGNRCSGRLLARDALMEVWRAREGISPPTALTELFVKHAGCADVDAMFLAFYRRELSLDDLEPAAPLVFEAARGGDATAHAILAAGGRHLAAMVNAVARTLGMTDDSFDVVMAGSVFDGSSPDLIDAVRDSVADVCPKARCRRPEFEPVVGALLMAYDAGNARTPALVKSLVAGIDDASGRFEVELRKSG